jgi:hypothetical protein
MGYLTKYGTAWGQIPHTQGTVYWVAPGAGSYTCDGKAYLASDENDGLSPERALATLDRGVNLATRVGDVVVAMQGDHTPAASLAMDSEGVTLMGLPSGAGNFTGQKTNILAVTGDQCVNITAPECEIAYLNFSPVTADTAIDLSSSACRTHIHHCSFDLFSQAMSTGTRGIEVLGALDNLLVDNCYFQSGGAQGPGIVVEDSTGCTVLSCIFIVSAGTWISAMTQAAAGRRLIVKDCLFDATSATMTRGIMGTTGGDVDQAFFVGNYNSVGVTKMLAGYDDADACICVNYIGTVDSGTGGTLVQVTK